jgi:hypothetical protein
MEENKNTIDQAINVIEKIISEHQSRSRLLLMLLLTITVLFVMLVGYPVVQKYVNVSGFSFSREVFQNDYTEQIIKNDSLSYDEYQILISKAVDLQKLVNERVNQEITLNKGTVNNTSDLSDYILYGIFILIFGVTASFYRFHLKEISKQEHYLTGFHRIRVAGNNSKTKYDDEVKISLTRNAFEFESSKNEKVVNPIPGHPTSDLASTLLNKILDKLEFKEKKENGS